MLTLSEETVIALWLAGEFNSARFSPHLHDLMEMKLYGKNIITDPDLSDEKENLCRKELLLSYRPYLVQENIFVSAVSWCQEDWFVSDALSKLTYMDYSYWNEISKQTSCPRDAAKSINDNVEIFGVSNEMFKSAAVSYMAGNDFPPVIAMRTSSNNKWTLLEGHLRLTALALAESQRIEIQNRKISVIYGVI